MKAGGGPPPRTRLPRTTSHRRSSGRTRVRMRRGHRHFRRPVIPRPLGLPVSAGPDRDRARIHHRHTRAPSEGIRSARHGCHGEAARPGTTYAAGPASRHRGTPRPGGHRDSGDTATELTAGGPANARRDGDEHPASGDVPAPRRAGACGPRPGTVTSRPAGASISELPRTPHTGEVTVVIDPAAVARFHRRESEISES